jgi:hypothetical protein
MVSALNSCELSAPRCLSRAMHVGSTTVIGAGTEARGRVTRHLAATEFTRPAHTQLSHLCSAARHRAENDARTPGKPRGSHWPDHSEALRGVSCGADSGGTVARPASIERSQWPRRMSTRQRPYLDSSALASARAGEASNAVVTGWVAGFTARALLLYVRPAAPTARRRPGQRLPAVRATPVRAVPCTLAQRTHEKRRFELARARSRCWRNLARSRT